MINPPRYKRPKLGLYPECEGCDEKRPSAFPEDTVGGKPNCLNCIADHGQRRGRCIRCGRDDVPLQGHHPFGARLQAAIGKTFADFTLDFCNGCHGVISDFLLGFVRRQSRLNGDKAATFGLFLEIALANYVFFFQPQLAEEIRVLMIGTGNHDRRKGQRRSARRDQP